MTENKRFTYSDVWGWNIDGFLNTMNGLDRKNNELKERIKELEQENKRLKYDLEHKQEHINQLTRKPLLTDILPQAHDILRINNELEEENEQLKKEGADVERLIDDLGSEELRRQYEEIINGDNDD